MMKIATKIGFYLIYSLRNNCLKSDPVGENSVAEHDSRIIAENRFFVDCSMNIYTTILSEGSLERSRYCGHFEPKNGSVRSFLTELWIL